MSNRVEALLMGVGPISEVCQAGIENACLDYDDVQSLVNAVGVLSKLLQKDKASACCVKACLAALLNQELPESIWLWTVLPSGDFDREGITNSGTRKLIASLCA